MSVHEGSKGIKMIFKRWRGPYFYASLTVVCLMLCGWVVGALRATSDNVYQRVLLLQDVVNQVSVRYVDQIPAEELYQRAVKGLLKSLDPYTELIPAEEYKRFLDIQVKSEYVGTGISINKVNDELVVMSTFPGSSAYRQGIQPGDRIAQVNGESTRAWTTEKASANLLGPEGTTVAVTISRVGANDPINLTLTRMPVVVPTVTRCFMLENGVGYLRLASFTERSAEELRSSLEELHSQGMTSLILDLRGNGGGLTQPAIDICNLFLRGKKLIVSIRSRNPKESESFFSSGEPVFKDNPMVVLIDDFSASSSEILAGALQDHDRAVIVGTNSFGKGLVQTTYQLGTGDVLKITTARYYTPCGRNIQREDYRRRRFEDDEEKDTTRKEEKFSTDMGREVKGGGGITPDVEVPEDSSANDPLVAQIFPHIFDFAVEYKSMHSELQKPFQADRKVFNAFLEYLKTKQVDLDPAEALRLRDYITANLLTYQIAQVTWDENTAYELVAHRDRQLARALEIVLSGKTEDEIFRKITEENKR